MIGTVLQVFVAIAIIIIMFVIAFSIYNMEFLKSIQDFGKVRTQVAVFTGIKDFSASKDESYDTLNKNSPLYLPFLPSYNQSGGTEYSYNFWLYLDPQPSGASGIVSCFNPPTVQNELSDAGLQAYLKVSGSDVTTDPSKLPIVLFLKGSKQVYNYSTLCNVPDDNNNPALPLSNKTIKSDILVKSPLIKLERGCDILTVEFNTYARPEGVKQSSRNTCSEISNQWEFMNSYKIGIKNLQTNTNFQKKWFMISVILQDTVPTDPYPIRNKIRCLLYVNGIIELDRYIDGKLGEVSTMGSVIKLNQGNLYVNPTITAKNVIFQDNSGNYKQSPGTDITFTNTVSNPKSVMMADLKYFNYALSSDDVASLFNMGFTKKYAPVYGNQLAINDQNDFMNQMSQTSDQKSLLEINQRAPTKITSTD